MNRGCFISLEGGEGAGKSTVMAVIAAALAARGIAHELTREPGGTPLAEAIRTLALDAHWTGVMQPETELLLVFAARVQHVRERIEPALAAGRWVVSDRYTDASYAYQGGGRGQPLARIAALEHWAAPLTPDLTFLLDVPVEQGLARAFSRGARDRMEREQAEFHERVRAAYHARVTSDPLRFRVIDARRSQSEVAESVQAELLRWIDSR
ncbi:MAG TPA: dTMP kinase [Patescibacteria group bacterium]|nr:dTMP kinase [Patescibacteria group bacterium]